MIDVIPVAVLGLSLLSTLVVGGYWVFRITNNLQLRSQQREDRLLKLVEQQADLIVAERNPHAAALANAAGMAKRNETATEDAFSMDGWPVGGPNGESEGD